MKRIVSILLSLCLVFGCANAVFADDVSRYSEEKIREDLSILQTLGIISDEYTEESLTDQKITRAEFCYYAAKMMKLQNYGDKAYFYDVPEGHWAYESINALAAIGAVSGYGDHLFMLDKEISLTEATAILLRLFGYSSDAFGASEYNSLISRLNLLKGYKGTSYMTFDDMIILLRNALECRLCETKMKTSETSYFIGNKTVLEEYYDSRFGSGMLSGADQISIYGDDLEEGIVVIDETEYNDGINNLLNYLGERINFIYRENDDNTRDILWCKPADKDGKVLKLGIETDKEYDVNTHRLKYYSGEHSYSADLSPNLTVLYNGGVYSDSDKALNAQKYSVKLLKTKNSGTYNLAIIEEYTNIIVSSINAEEKCVYDRESGEKISLNPDDYDRVTVIDKNEEPLGFDKIESGDCISIYRSQGNKFIKAAVSKDTVTGKVSSMSTAKSEEQYVSIDDRIYTPYRDTDVSDISVGDNVKLFLDACGYIAGSEKITSAIRAAFVLKTYIREFEDDAWIRLFTEDGKCADYMLADSFRINDIRIKSNKKIIKSLLSDKQLILYELNRDNRLNRIDTVTANGKLRQLTPFMAGTYKGGSGRVNKKTVIDKNTLIFSVPNDLKNAKAEDFSVRKMKDFVHDSSYTVAAYAVSDKDGYAEIIVVQGKEWGKAGSYTAKILVDSIGEALNADDDTVYQISGNRGTVRVELLTEDKDVLNNRNIESGDIIDCVMNDKGYVKSVNKIYDESVREDLSNINLYGIERIITAYIKSVEGDIMNIGYNSRNDYDEKWNCKNAAVLIYDPNLRTDKVQPGTIEDLKNAAASQEYSRIVLQSSYSDIVQVIIYK